MKVGIIDYGAGNLGSVRRALEELRVTPILLSHSTEIGNSDVIILPGVGNFTDCMRMLHEGGWVEALEDEVQARSKPLLGICVGMQMLASHGMEGSGSTKEGTNGLGFIPGRVEHLEKQGCRSRVPHVGWNEVRPADSQNGLFKGIPERTDFYFVHSYTFIPTDPADIRATVNYDIDVTAAVGRGHIWGTQFHPEKSSKAGFRLLRNFVEGALC